jgi:hypothetical protein
MLFVSQPGVAEPTAMLISTFEWSANADGVIAIIEKTANNTNSEYTAFFIFIFFFMNHILVFCVLSAKPQI